MEDAILREFNIGKMLSSGEDVEGAGRAAALVNPLYPAY